jgi:hypothetical protein
MAVLWPGKQLDAGEEVRLRRVVALLQRVENNGRAEAERKNAARDRQNLERFLPEDEDKWTPDELEFGAHNGPWFEIGDVKIEEL